MQLSIEDIDSQILELQNQLNQLSSTDPWEQFENQLNKTFEKKLEKEKKLLEAKYTMRAILEKYFTQEIVTAFFNTFEVCNSARDFAKVQKLYSIVNSEERSAIVLAFNVYRVCIAELNNQDNKSLVSYVKKLSKQQDELSQNIINDINTVTL